MLAKLHGIIAGFIGRHIFIKYLLATLLIGVTGNALVLLFYSQYRQADQSGRIASEIATVANRLARPAAKLAQRGDISQARDLLSIFAAYPYVICVDLLLEADKELAVSWPVIGCSRINKPGHELDVALPGAGSGASMHVRIDPVTLGRRLKGEFAVLLVLGTVGGLALTAAGIMAFLWFINRPLKLLLNSIELFEQNDDPRLVDYRSEDEIGKVISSYNIMLDREVERVSEIRDAHNSILDSVAYATRIQRGLLPTAEQLAAAFAEFSELWRPRDLVGGDIYWVHTRTKSTTVVLLDCTGHGVPGGFMTMLAIASLERIFSEDEYLTPGKVLTRLSDLTKGLLNQNSENAQSNDGMDAGICMLENGSSEGIFAGAHLSMTVCSAQGISRIRGDRMSLGYTDTPVGPQFQEVRFHLQEDTRMFMHTDGITDQIGGPRHIAFGYNLLAKLIQRHSGRDLATTLAAIEAEISNYAGDEPRRDDLTVLAFRANRGAPYLHG